ncbi:DHH family phosphoesterase [Salarchaeum sp. JOR-1]|uniref:DHH family phosphoesterase n=1 Tax=Salarchaeum sp. JOR-1 TaxID=2599399 RepID=UPI001198BBDC|nr:DHH family phosphoesterase [Salarchaeum sp. JOR-1]QDX39665.1 bifunctional oligoribonuclease/PAP phosphatase NrnA [Salarchaeum sp. JOR-1]
MVFRLVLGCGTTGNAVVDELSGEPGGLLVLDSDASRVESLRNEKVPAETADITDSASIDRETNPDIVFVGADEPETNLGGVRAVTTAYPDAYVVAFSGFGATRSTRDALAASADRVVDVGAAVLDDVANTAARSDSRCVHALRGTLQAVEGRLAVFMHDNPDPDAIASAVALTRIADAVGTPADPCYFGEISHQENRAFVNLLDLDLVNLDPDASLDDYAGIALVDHSQPGVNDQLPPDTDVNVVIDHHPSDGAIDADFVDVRPEMGAASTILVEYLRQLGVDLDTSVATGLLYGIRVDTKDFSREITTADFEAAAELLAYADVDVLERVESPNVSADTFDVIARGIGNRQLNGSVLASCVGAINDRDTLSQAADRLLAMEGVTVTFVYGFMDGTVYASARARGADVDLGSALREAFDDLGSAGGHADMAGAQIPMGVFDVLEDDAADELQGVLEDTIAARFFDAVR